MLLILLPFSLGAMSERLWASCSRPCIRPIPTNIIPTKIAGPKLSGKFPMGLGIPPLENKIMLESNPSESIILVRKLAVAALS